MNRAGTALAALLAAAALVSGCTGDTAEPDDAASLIDDGMFGPDPDYEQPTADLLTATADGDPVEVCDALERSFEERDLNAHFEEGTEGACGFDVYSYLESDPIGGETTYTTGIGAALPVRVHVWADETGTKVGYFDPAAMVAAVGATGIEDFGAALSVDVNDAVAEAAGAEPEAGATADLTYTVIESEMPPIDLVESIERAADGTDLVLSRGETYGADDSEFSGGTLTYTLAGPDRQAHPAHLYEISPAIGVADQLKLHVYTDRSGNGTIAYFDPVPLFSAVGPEFADAGFEASTILSDTAWQAAEPG